MYLYDADEAVTKQTLGNGSYVTYDYDDAGRLTSLVNSKSDDSTLSSFAYLLDSVGNRTKMTYSDGDYIEYLYDAVYKLTKESKYDSGDSSIYTQEFYYWGAVGDRTKLVTTGDLGNTTTEYSYNFLDQLTSKTVGGTTTTYSYDANGNLTKADDTTNTWTYDYDWDNRLTSYDAPGSSDDTTYGYDSLGWRRVKKTVNGTLTKYLPDAAGTDVLTECDSSNNLVRSYVTPSIDENVSLYDGTNTYYYMRDGLGSVRGLYSSAEALQNSYEYESFGQALSASENLTQPYRFTGRAWDSNSSLYFYRTRYYDPDLALFTQKDKVWKQTLLAFTGAARQADAITWLLPIYAYAANNPVSFKDPWGQGITIDQCKCERNAAILNDPVVGFLFMEAKRQGCLDKIRCDTVCLATNILGRYKRERSSGLLVIELCWANLNAGGVKETLHHELEHALSVCGDFRGHHRCGKCMIEEMRAYYCSEHCNWPTDCAFKALTSCTTDPPGRSRPACVAGEGRAMLLAAQMEDPPPCMHEIYYGSEAR